MWGMGSLSTLFFFLVCVSSFPTQPVSAASMTITITAAIIRLLFTVFFPVIRDLDNTDGSICIRFIEKSHILPIL